MARSVEVLLCNQDAFCTKRLVRFVLNNIVVRRRQTLEELLVDCFSILLGNEHGCELAER